MIPINVVISAAGMGTRLGLDIPKCLLKINGETLLARQLKQTKECQSVYVVVGYKEELVMDEVFKYRKDAIIVRNPMYATTSNAYSLSMGSQYCDSFLALDGDVWFPEYTMYKMLNRISNNPERTLLFATPAKTDDAVFMNVTDNMDCFLFSRTKKSSLYEWSGCAYYHKLKITRTARYVFEEIIPSLPLPVMVIDCWEVDTKHDLAELQKVKEDYRILSFFDIVSIEWVVGRGLVIPLRNDNENNYTIGEEIQLSNNETMKEEYYTINGIEKWFNSSLFALNLRANHNQFTKLKKDFLTWREKHSSIKNKS